MATMTDEEMAAFEASKPLTMTDEEMEALHAAPVQPPPPISMTDQEMEDFSLSNNLSGQRSDALDDQLPKGSLSAVDAAMTMVPSTLNPLKDTASAQGEFYSKGAGWLENAFYTLTLPEQFVARQVVNVLENAGALSTDDAREILVRDQVHGSDIINYYWRDPTTWYGKAGRFVTGLAADILIDPLSYVGVGALTKGAKAATVAGKTLTGLDKVSKAERAYYKTLEAVEGIIKSDTGKVVSVGEDAIDVAKQNQMAIARAVDTQMGFDQLQAQLLASPSAKNQMLEQIRVGMTEKSWADEWYEGSRGLTFGARIPFTDKAFEVDLPGHISKLASLPVLALDGAFDFGKSLIRKTPWGDAGFNLVADIGTRTGKFIFDAQQNIRLGTTSLMTEELGQFENASRAMLVQKQKSMGTEQFASFLADITDEIEMGLKSPEEALRIAQTYDRVGTDLSFLTKGTKADVERAARLSVHPDALEMIEDMRQIMQGGVDAYKARGIPFEELNPFGPGWAKNYIKHDISIEFLDKFKEVNQASDIISEAMESFPSLMGRVDQSAKARKYRGTIREANAASLEKYGVKMFVDDPIELITKRAKEMNKVVQNHDLMESALPYAIQKDNLAVKIKDLNKRLEAGEITEAEMKAALAGDDLVGYVKYSPDDFRRLSIDETDEFGTTWDSFVPEGYKTGRSLYLPEDVYDRMLFNINGWDVSRPLTKFLGAADFYTNVWRNNALFGASYIGLNAFSNALTYLSFNNISGPQALAKATSILTPFGKNMKMAFPQLGEMTGEALFKMALEDNVLGSAMARKVEFSQFAEHVASNRQARQTLGDKVMSVADVAFLWRYSRGIAQFADEVPKLATYISRLEKGFSRKGAAEAAERYFYNFNNMSKIQSGVATLIPFSSFPMKTAEMVAEQLKTGKLASLTIPGKVQAALDGAFVQDHETRQAMDKMLPRYRSMVDPIHGELMPGMREVQIDVPWAYATIQSLFNPEDSQHPIFNIFQLMGAFKTKTEELLGLQTEQDAEVMAEQAYQTKKVFAQTLDLAIPSYLREALTLAEINGAANFGGFFRDRYASTMPTRTQFERAMSGRATLDQSTVYHKFTNAAEFGQAMDEKYGESWLYNMVFRNRIDDDSVASMDDAGVRGEFVRRRMRQFSLGLASMSKLDSTFFMNTFAIKRQIDIKERAIKSEIVRSGALVDTERISDEKFLAKWADQIPAAKELMALYQKKEALTQYYDFFLGAEKAAPEVNLIKLLVGADEYEFDYGDKPDEEVYRRLFKQKTIDGITDEEAGDVMESIREKEGL